MFRSRSRRAILFFAGVLAGLVSTSFARADTYLIQPDGTGDFPDIASAVAAAQDGDLLLLADGVFTGPGNTGIDYLGKAITIRSQSGDPATCVIDCEGVEGRRGFKFASGETSSSVLQGVTIRGGSAPPEGVYQDHRGGAVHCDGSSPQILDCAFVGNTAEWGGALYVMAGTPLIQGCRFHANHADDYGAGAYLRGDAVSLSDCSFAFNDGPGSQNAAAYISPSSDGLVTITSCTFYRNDVRAGLRVSGHGGLLVSNTIIAFTSGLPALVEPFVESAVSCCNLYGNLHGDYTGSFGEGWLGVDGNIAAPPRFCDPEGYDFQLAENSACAPYSAPNPECDLIGSDPVGCGPVENLAACCYVGYDHLCVLTTPAECAFLEGDYLPGIGSCDPFPCDPILGACCACNGACTVLTEEQCWAAESGAWMPEIACEPNPCPLCNICWACCLGADCHLMGSEACAYWNGDFLPDLEWCDPNPCEPSALEDGELPWRPGPPRAANALRVLLAEGSGDVVEIRYRLDQAQAVDLAIYDSAGRLVRRLRDGQVEPAGEHILNWSGTDAQHADCSPGVYFCVLATPSQRSFERVLLLP